MAPSWAPPPYTGPPQPPLYTGPPQSPPTPDLQPPMPPEPVSSPMNSDPDSEESNLKRYFDWLLIGKRQSIATSLSDAFSALEDEEYSLETLKDALTTSPAELTALVTKGGIRRLITVQSIRKFWRERPKE